MESTAYRLSGVARQQAGTAADVMHTSMDIDNLWWLSCSIHNCNADIECKFQINKILRSDLMPVQGRHIGCMCEVSRSKYKILYANSVVCPLGEVLRL